MLVLYELIRIADFIVVFVTAIIAHGLYFNTEPSTPWQNYYLAGFVGALLATIVFQLNGMYVYKVHKVPFGRLRIASLTMAWFIVLLVMILLGFAFRISDAFSRVWVGLWFSLALCGMTTVRLMRFHLERTWLRQGKLTRNIAIYGSGEGAAKLIQTLRESGDISFRIEGYFDSRRDDKRWHPKLEPERYLGGIKDVIAYGRKHRIDQIIVALPWTAEQRILEVCKKLRSLPADIQLAPDFVGFHLLNSTHSITGGVTVINVFMRPLTDWKIFIKAIEDRVLAFLGLVVLSPLLLLIAMSIKLDSTGPVFFRQQRYGFNHKLIPVYKFRTMYTHLADHNADKLTVKNDPRVTKLGAFLRKTSLDELPQLINVLKGEMSIVGPRPHATGAKAADRLYEEIVDEYAVRHRVKPGITGWAQVKGWRGETDTEEKILKRVEHDLYYIDHWSLGLDIKILLMTVRAVCKTDNVY